MTTAMAKTMGHELGTWNVRSEALKPLYHDYNNIKYI
jgi:hypothetical protein